jgi:flagellar hook-length control protein FliK
LETIAPPPASSALPAKSPVPATLATITVPIGEHEPPAHEQAGMPAVADAPSTPRPPDVVDAPDAARPLAAQLADTIVAEAPQLRRDGAVELFLDLQPPELGRLRVRLSARNEELNIHVVVDNDAARLLLHHEVDSLRTRLHELGIALGQFDVRRDGSNSSFERRPTDTAMVRAPARLVPGTQTPVRTRPGSTGIDLLA